jgi:membrane protein
VIRRKFKFLSSLKEIIAKSIAGWVEHDASTRGAALAFYTVFSIAPIISIAIGAVGLVVQGDFLRANLLNQTQELLGASGVAAVKALLTSASYLGRNRIPTFIGIVTLLLGASSVFVELQNSLDRIWELPRRKRMSGLWRILRTRFLSIGLVLGVGFLLIVSLVVSAVLAAFGTWLSSILGPWRITVSLMDVVLSVGLSASLFALLFKYVPQERSAWADVWVGGLATAILFNVGKFAIGIYLGKSAFASVYGVVGSFLVLLLWVYYSAQIFLLGAEFTKNYSLVMGARVRGRDQEVSA